MYLILNIVTEKYNKYKYILYNHMLKLPMLSLACLWAPFIFNFPNCPGCIPAVYDVDGFGFDSAYSNSAYAYFYIAYVFCNFLISSISNISICMTSCSLALIIASSSAMRLSYSYFASICFLLINSSFLRRAIRSCYFTNCFFASASYAAWLKTFFLCLFYI